jgi:hypothetical protein
MYCLVSPRTAGMDGEGLRSAIGPNIAPGRNPDNYNYTYIPYTQVRQLQLHLPTLYTNQQQQQQQHRVVCCEACQATRCC